MKYEVGDEILVLHTNEEGKVIEIMNDKMVMIEVRGVKFPAYMDQIDFPYFQRFSKKKSTPQTAPKQYIDTLPKEKVKPITTKAQEGLWISLLPKFTTDEFEDEIVENFKIYLVNKTNTKLLFQYKQQLGTELNFQLNNTVAASQDFYLHDISFANLNDSPSFYLHLSLVTPNKQMADFVEKNIKLKGKQIFKLVEEMKAKNLPTINLPLLEKFPEKTVEEKFETSSLVAKGYKVYEAKKIRENLAPPRSVIDLHMEKLSDTWQNMSNYEILSMQLNEFQNWYDLSVSHLQPNLIVIHGVGSGKLRDEIHEILKTKREVKYFTNQYSARFGYGATEIFFQY